MLPVTATSAVDKEGDMTKKRAMAKAIKIDNHLNPLFFIMLYGLYK